MKTLGLLALVAMYFCCPLVVPNVALADQEPKQVVPGRQWLPIGALRRQQSVTPLLNVQPNANYIMGSVTQPSLTVVWPNGTTAPATFADLNSGVDSDMYELSMDDAAKLNIPILTLDASASAVQRILILDHIAYKNVTMSDGSQARVGAGIRWIMELATTSANANLSFPAVAAQAQLNVATAKVLIEQIGMNDAQITQDLEVPTEVDVDNYVKMSDGFNEAITALAPTTPVQPVVVQLYSDVSAPDDSQYHLACLQAFALACVANGKTINTAQHDCPYQDAQSQSSVSDVYRSKFGITDPNQHPSAIDVDVAKSLIGSLNVKT